MFKHFACAALLAIAISPAAVAAEDDDDRAAVPNPRVRPNDGRSAAALLQGIARSETVRLIVERLETLDVIVYVEMQAALQHKLAGRMVWLAATQHFRYVRISLNYELSGETLIAVLGHELRHALEVALSPSIVGEPSLEAYYEKNGINMRSHANGWDTQAARDAGELVRRELAAFPARAAVEPTQPFDVTAWQSVYRRTRDRFTGR
jgi:hypothetical protein